MFGQTEPEVADRIGRRIMIKGSCLCGSIRYEVTGAVDRLLHCHCSQCRKAHGAAFGSYGRVNASAFRFTSGEEYLAGFASSEGVKRIFCKRCGTRLQFVRDSNPQTIWLAAGTLDDDPVVRPSCHIFVDSKAPWFHITDDLPQFSERSRAN